MPRFLNKVSTYQDSPTTKREVAKQQAVEEYNNRLLALRKAKYSDKISAAATNKLDALNAAEWSDFDVDSNLQTAKTINEKYALPETTLDKQTAQQIYDKAYADHLENTGTEALGTALSGMMLTTGIGPTAYKTGRALYNAGRLGSISRAKTIGNILGKDAIKFAGGFATAGLAGTLGYNTEKRFTNGTGAMGAFGTGLVGFTPGMKLANAAMKTKTPVLQIIPQAATNISNNKLSYEAPQLNKNVVLIPETDIMLDENPGKTVGSKLIRSKQADKIANEVEARIRDHKTNLNFLQEQAREYASDPATYLPEIKNLADKGDPVSTQTLSALKSIAKGRFDVNDVVGARPLEKDLFRFSKQVDIEHGYPLSLIPWIRGTIRNRKVFDNGNWSHYGILGGIKGVSEKMPIIEGKEAQRPLMGNYQKNAPEEVWDGQYVSSSDAVAMFYAKLGTTSGTNYYKNLIDSQTEWSTEAKTRASQLVDYIHDGLTKLSDSGRARENALTESTANKILMKEPMPIRYNFPGDLNTGIVDNKLYMQRQNIADAINALHAMLLHKNSIGAIELYARSPRSNPTINYRGDWWKENILKNKVAPYDLRGTGAIEDWKLTSPKAIIAATKNIDTMSHHVGPDQAATYINIRDAINGPIGTDRLFGKNIYGLKQGGFLSKK